MIHLSKELDLETTDFEYHLDRTPSVASDTIKNLKLTVTLGMSIESF